MNQDLQWGGQTEIKSVMNSDLVDFWASPYTYENRGIGNFASLRMAIQSLNKHGKIYFAECDTFFNDSSEEALAKHRYPSYSDDEDEAVFKRDFAYTFIEGCNGWWNDWSCGKKLYGMLNPLVRRMNEISLKGFDYNRSNVSDIAGVIDEESLYIPACNSKNHSFPKTDTPEIKLMDNSLHRFRIHELPRLGTPVDFYETNDVLDPGERKYRMYIFINQYSADDYERKKIEENLKKDGNVLVWMYGSGLLNPDDTETLNIKYAEELTDFKFGYDMIEARCVMSALKSDWLPDIKQGEKLGDCRRELKGRSNSGCKYHEHNLVNPLIYVEDNDAIPLATFDANGKVGMAIKQFDDWTSVYIGSPYIQANVLRDFAKIAGAHLYVDDEEIVFANESYIGIHTAKDGKRTIKLRKESKVTEVFEDKNIGENITEFEEDIPKHSTRLYEIL